MDWPEESVSKGHGMCWKIVSAELTAVEAALKGKKGNFSGSSKREFPPPGGHLPNVYISRPHFLHNSYVFLCQSLLTSLEAPRDKDNALSPVSP